jgi:hypothetical protein
MSRAQRGACLSLVHLNLSWVWARAELFLSRSSCFIKSSSTWWVLKIKLNSTRKKEILIFCGEVIQVPLVPNLYSLYYYELYAYELKFMNYVTLYDYNIYIYIYTYTHTRAALMSESSLFTNIFASIYRLIIEYSFMLLI